MARIVKKRPGKKPAYTFADLKAIIKKKGFETSGDLRQWDVSAYQYALGKNWFRTLGLSMSRGRR